MTAKGKQTATRLTSADRVLIEAETSQYATPGNTFRPATRLTGDSVRTVRVLSVESAVGTGKVRVTTTEGAILVSAHHTFTLAPETPAAVKRAHAEAIEELTLNSQDGKVELDSENDGGEADMTSTDTETELPDPDGSNLLDVPVPVIRELTGSAVVKLLERVHERIRQNHPEVPEVVIVTGAGIGFGGGKWGHFRPQGWTTGETSIHEMFMAGETLAKGARQVLQTMIHESAHALAEHRGEKDTSRQGRWHNQVFLKTAKELGLEYKANGLKADKALGFSQVTLTEETVEEYRDLLDELDREICLMVRLPGWLGGTTEGGQDGDEGGHTMGKAPSTGTASTSNNVKLTCECEEPNIIRASKKVAAKMVVNCGDCDALFLER